MKKILLTGSSGQLGRAVRKEYGKEAEFILTDVEGPVLESPEGMFLDITDADQVQATLQREQPDVVINCGAMTNVDGCESAYETAFRINALGPRNLAAAAEEIGAKLIHISTDYVFSGTDPNPLKESEEPDPISAYGRTKLAGERYVRECTNRFFILRTAWLYGEGKNFVKTMLRLAETRDEIAVVDDQIGSPTSASELAKVIHRLEPTIRYGVYHATCEGSVSWAGFAERIFEKAGCKVKVNPISSAEYKRLNPDSADRPLFSILDNAMLRLNGFPPMADWETAFDEYIKGGV
ncbi:MAG: dTDP-4-dehydrorhamnose reductase [Eubacterium sp.]|nr:dTDP-4-dehydrorhamnose reductase [Eubacterium sp.]